MMKIFPLFCLALLFPATLLADEKVAPIRIGVIIPLSGEFALYGENVKSGIEEAKNPQVEFIYEDEGCDPAKTLSAFKKLSEIDKVTFFIGPSCGSPQQVLIPEFKKGHYLGMLVSSAARDIFADSGENIFSAQYSIEDESEFNAEVFNQRDFKKIAIVFVENQFSRAHEVAFRAKSKADSIETIAFPGKDPSQLKSVALKLKKLAPDAIYVPDALPFLLGLRTELSKIGLGAIPVYSIYAAQMEDVIKAEGKSSEGILYSYPMIAEANAFNYFPKMGAKILVAAITGCKGELKCTHERIKSYGHFEKNGTLNSPIELRVIRNAKFETFVNEHSGEESNND